MPFIAMTTTSMIVIQLPPRLAWRSEPMNSSNPLRPASSSVVFR
jgi:hypothetical protein